LSAVLIDGPLHGSVSLAADGSFVYTSFLNYQGTDRFTYRAWDGHSFSNIGVANILVTPVADRPIAVNDSFPVLQDTTSTIAAPGVMANDINPDRDPLTLPPYAGLTAALLTAPIHAATFTFNADGSFLYRPHSNYVGTDTFTYHVTSSGGTSDVATVTLTVVATRPTAVDDRYSLLEDSILTVLPNQGVMVNDLNPDNLPLTAVVVNGPIHGGLSFDNATGGFTYTPVADYFGPDSFTYYLSTNGGSLLSNIATVSLNVVNVNDAPVAVNDSYTIGEDQTLFGDVLGVMVNDFDVDGDPLTATLITGPLHGSMTLNSNGRFTYIPDANWNGTETMTYRISDGRGLPNSFSNIATITISVTPAPDTPTAADDSYSLLEDTTLVVATPGILINDVNPDALPPSPAWTGLTPTVVNGPLHGTLVVAANGSLTYTPVGNYYGTDSFTYYVTNTAGLTSTTATVTLTVVGVPDRPIANNDFFQTQEDVALVVGIPGVLWNDQNPDDFIGPAEPNGGNHASPPCW
jgi:hypothetical protein